MILIAFSVDTPDSLDNVTNKVSERYGKRQAQNELALTMRLMALHRSG